MTFNVELFSKLIENKNYTNQDLIDILIDKGFDTSYMNFFDFDRRVDGIIMNPPYIRQELLTSENNKDILRKKIKFKNINWKSTKGIVLISVVGLIIFGVAYLSVPDDKKYYSGSLCINCNCNYCNNTVKKSRNDG